MSKPRFNWWPFALNMIRDYPARKRDLQDLRAQKVTASASGLPGGGGASRTTEDTALRELPAQEMREYEAVRQAVEMTRAMPSGRDRLKVVAWNLWAGTHTLAGAALVLHVQERTARRWRHQFILAVGRAYGFLTEEEYREAMKKDQRTGK